MFELKPLSIDCSMNPDLPKASALTYLRLTRKTMRRLSRCWLSPINSLKESSEI